MSIRKKFSLIISILIICIPTVIFSGSSVQAAENEINTIVEKNDIYIELEREYNQLVEENKEGSINKYSLNSSDSPITKEQAIMLIEKYDGAGITVYSGNTSYENIMVNFGMNSFAKTKAGMESLRTDLGIFATELRVAGVIVGTGSAGIIGALVALAGTQIIAGRLDAGQGIMSSWINVGSTKGGCRITVTDAFAIDNINSTSQCRIRKL